MASDTAITWLHLSDFHAGQRSADVVWTALDDPFERDLRYMAKRLGPPDLLLFTGDLTFKGAPDEFQRVDRLLAKVREWLGAPDLPIYAVPGNHDLPRPKDTEFDALARYETLANYEASDRPRKWLWESTLTPEQARPHDPLFANYMTWATRTMIEPAAAAGRPLHLSPRMPGDFAATFTKHDIRLGLIGLNSTWVQYGEGEYEGRLQLPAEQLQAVLPNLFFRGVDDSLLLTHHPPSWLTPLARETYERDIYTPDRFALALFGHAHRGHALGERKDGSASRNYYQAHSLLGLEKYGTKNASREFGYAWGRISASGEVRVWPRKVVLQGGAQAFERDVNLREVDDALGGVLARAAKQPAAARPVSNPPTPAPFVSPTTPALGLGPDELACYRDHLLSEHETIQLFGFGPDARTPLELDGLFVELDAVIDPSKHGAKVYSSAMHAEDAKRDLGRHGHEPTTLAQAFAKAREIAGLRGLVVLGDPGSGKTTHLRQLVLQVVRDGSASLGLPADLVPVFISLQSLRGRPRELAPLIDAQLPQDPTGRRRPDFGARLVADGRLLVLLDGLDEVADADERKAVSDWIANVHKTMRNAHFVVTCRYAGYVPTVALPDQFLELHLRPLGDTQMHDFVHKWYRLAIRALARTPERAKLDPVGEANDLLGVLTTGQYVANARVHEMTRNPLLLTAICLVHLDRGRLPDARGKLYEKSIDVLLERWQRRRSDRSVDDDEARELMQAVALAMHEAEARWSPAAELRAPIERRLAALGRTDLDVDRFLAVVRNDAALLTGWGIDEFGFMHLGFQEFLAAKQIGIDGHRDNAAFVRLAARFGEPWWQEVILLLLAQRNPDAFAPFMRALVDQPNFVEWSSAELMQLCLRETPVFQASPFLEVLTRDGADTQLRRAAARVLQAKDALPPEFHGLLIDTARSGQLTRLDARTGLEFVRIPAGTHWMGSLPGVGYDDERPRHQVTLASFEIARTPVTNAHYQRYLEDPEVKPAAPKPAYWSDRQYNKPNQPVVGVSWHEAMAYCAWAGFELPTEAQWEVACRAGSDSQYCNGDTEADLDRVGWYDGNSEDRLHPVAERQPNAWGLYDMHGNVWEWCRDGHGASYDQPVRAGDGLRREPDSDGSRVMRGGSFDNSADNARSADRDGDHAGFRYRYLGLRPARVIPGDFTTSPPSR